MIRKLPACPADAPFLFQLYASTREAELQAWGWDEQMRRPFLHMQWMAQKNSYTAQYPDAEELIIHLNDSPAGRILTARTNDSLLLVDIALLPIHQNQGIGSLLIRELQEEAVTASLKLVLHVLPDSPALRLYQRLGFGNTGVSGLHLRMEWSPVLPPTNI
ncbi:GNAT family N-acetyltransferase [Paenibacillus lutrae]|uniref:GNAT family N-acetyltransferase n=1 Tax=Paenibacillus lutrae TaxID=2078573 RepID=A0A7X3FJS8_9BACL|nr:GNAT family N-acetyltransferase [Paenibacillus lutrae]MVP00986.1 GNAT family N-acetyltransferase [Paenibacillus lutrae]